MCRESAVATAADACAGQRTIPTVSNAGSVARNCRLEGEPFEEDSVRPKLKFSNYNFSNCENYYKCCCCFKFIRKQRVELKVFAMERD